MIRFSQHAIEPGARSHEEISLADYFPFNTVGEYRCTITKRIYDHSSTSNEISGAGVRGDPFDLTAPEFSFRVESLKHVERTVGTVNVRTDKVLDGIDNKSSQTRPFKSTPSFNEDGTKGSSVRNPANNPSFPVQSKAPSTSTSPWWWLLLVIPAILFGCLVLRPKRQG